MIRVAFLTNQIPHYRSDFIKRLVSSLDGTLDIFVHSNNQDGYHLEHQQNLGCNIIPLPTIRFNRFHLVIQRIPLLRMFSQYDVFIISGNPREIGSFFAGLVLKTLGKPVILWGHAHTAGSNPRSEAIRLKAWRFFDYLIVYNDAEVDALRAHGFKSQQIIGLQNGLDQQNIGQIKSCWSQEKLMHWQLDQQIPVDQFKLLSVCRLIPKNKLRFVIDLLSMLKEKYQVTPAWFVIGDGDEGPKLMADAQRKGVDEQIHWLGSIYDENQLAPWFLSADLLIHPGAIGLTLLHAFGYELPVLTHSNSKNQMPEFLILNQNQESLLFQEDDLEDCTKQVLCAIHDQAKLAAKAKRGYALVEKQYNTTVMAERVHQLLKIIGNKSTR